MVRVNPAVGESGMFRRILLLAVFLVVVLAAVLLVNLARFRSVQLEAKSTTPIAVDKDGAVQRFAKALTFKTISHQIPWEFRGTAFTEFHAYLSESFPLVHAKLTREVVSDYSLMYTWTGSDPGLKPVVLLAHMDVVPVDAGSAELWTHDPFAGTVADGRVWGRGALDDKSSVMAILETVESLLRDGWTPKRTLFFCFGHDEELGGPAGAKVMAETLKARGVKAWFSMDEGSGIADGILPGIEGPVALIATCEKGYVSLKLEVEGKGGHSSKPPANTSLGLLCAAVARLEAQQFTPAIQGPIREMLDVAGREMAFPLNLVMANMWLTEPLLIKQLANSDTTRAALRTTTAPTILNAGTKENVLPIKAEAVVNFRIYPGDTVEQVVAHAKQVVNDERVKISILDDHEALEASPVSDIRSDSYQMLAQSIRNVHPTFPVAPAMSIGGTDSKHFYEVAENCYRFQPMVFKQSDFDTIHGTDESCSIDVYLNGIQLYAEIIRNAAG